MSSTLSLIGMGWGGSACVGDVQDRWGAGLVCETSEHIHGHSRVKERTHVASPARSVALAKLVDTRIAGLTFITSPEARHPRHMRSWRRSLHSVNDAFMKGRKEGLGRFVLFVLVV